MSRLRVCIDGRLDIERAGGVASVIAGLAAGLSSLADGDEEYLFLTIRGRDLWLREHIAGAVQIASVDVPPARSPSALRRAARRAPGLYELYRRQPLSRRQAARAIDCSDGTVERLGADIMHFPKQSAFLTEIPSIYHPHDLQHLHLPTYFSRRAIELRELQYRAYCESAAMVAVTSSWTRKDVISHYNLPPDKVQVVPWAPAILESDPAKAEEIQDARRRLALPDPFILYPAQTWPHKNHAKLFEALARLRNRGLVVPLVLSGFANNFAATLRRRAAALRVDDQITWLGFVSRRDLAVLYRACRAVVVPTKFEAASGPVWEAFQLGAPVACSRVTSLPEQAGDAALLFDPDDSVEIAQAIERLWNDSALREKLADRGRARITHFTWGRTARLFRAHYRRLAGRKLEPSDQALLDEPAYL
jgi:glycosyltransferase involved in cell wall biosynthesis